MYCDYAKLGFWRPIFVSNYTHMPYEIVLNEWYELECILGSIVVVVVVVCVKQCQSLQFSLKRARLA